MPGVLTRRDSVATRAPPISDLDELPFPDWGQMSPALYTRFPRGAATRRLPVAPVLTTRGCPFSCSFCASPGIWGRKIRFRGPESVVDEIEYLVGEFSVRVIHFE